MKVVLNHHHLLPLFSLIIISISVELSAQRPPVMPIPVQDLRLDFRNPGARSASLGGAFIGAAQDETSSVINPAGLGYLTYAGASLHHRQSRHAFEIPATDSPKEFHDTNINQSMATSFVPVKKVTIALFHQIAIDSRSKFESQQFLSDTFEPTSRQALGGVGNFPGRDVAFDLELIYDGIAIGFPVSKRLSIGLSGKSCILSLKLNQQTFLDPGVSDGFEPSGNGPGSTYSITTIDERKVKPAFTLGMIAKLIIDKLFIGGVYHYNPAFDLKSDIFFPIYQINGQEFPAEQMNEVPFSLDIPDIYGAGLYYILSNRLRFTFDIVRISYSNLIDSRLLNAPEDDEPVSQSVQFIDPDGRNDLQISDVTRFHFGAEYLIKTPTFGLIPLRFGMYTDPDHSVHAIADDNYLRRLYPKKETLLHITFGGGFVINKYLKFDGSLDFSKDGYDILGSAMLSVPFN